MYKIVLTTTDRKKVAKNISEEILINKLSPCVQILAPVESSFIWNGEIERSKEFLVKIKTIKANLKSIEKIINKIHNYEVPEIVIFDFKILNSKYKKWFNNNI